MEFEGAVKEFDDFLYGTEIEGLKVHRSIVAFDEPRDGEAVARVLLLVDDPIEQTWELESVMELRSAAARKATEVGLPPISVSLVPESEADSVADFAR